MELGAQLPLQPDPHVLHYGQVRKGCRDLKGADQPPAGCDCWRLTGDVLSIEDDAAAGGWQELGQQVEYGGLAGAVGADQGVDMAATDLQIDVGYCRKALELLRQAGSFQDELAHGTSRLGAKSVLRPGGGEGLFAQARALPAGSYKSVRNGEGEADREDQGQDGQWAHCEVSVVFLIAPSLVPQRVQTFSQM